MFLALAVVIIAAALLAVILRKRFLRGAASLVTFAVALLVWGVAYGLFLQPSFGVARIWLALIYLSNTAAVSSLLFFVLYYTNRGSWIPRWSVFALLGLEPLLTQVFLWAPGWQGNFYLSLPSPGGPIPLAGPWYWIHQTYIGGLLVMGLVFLARSFVQKSRIYVNQSLTIAAALVVPLLARLLEFTGIAPFAHIDLAPYAYALSAVLLVAAVLAFKLLDIHVVSRDGAIEAMGDGWMVVDLQNRIVDLNPAAEEIIGASRRELFACPADQVLAKFPNLNQEISGKEMEVRASMSLRGERHFLTVRFLPLNNSAGKLIGRIVLWRDITERKKSDDARQKARDEMFVLLHALSGAASQNLNLDDFLTEVSRLLIHTFQSQVSLIFLAQSGLSGTGQTKYFLAAQQGIPAENLPHLTSSKEVGAIIETVMRSRETFLVPDAATDERLTAPMRQSGVRSILLSPLVTREQCLGVIGVTRREGPAYAADEITRMAVVAEEVASLILSDRQRQLAAVLEERQRMVRDLHDSVTQKLYGLVQLTEAAKASLENGTFAQSAGMINRIGENARQALREMRLFLFERKPVDLEHEGLVSVLHQRLAAVEGRADIKPDFHVDDGFDMPIEQQVTFYFIAQEALNNILKHANAHSVEIHLLKREPYYVLEIVDDGCGFDPARSDRGGLGLRSMHERVARVGGKLSIKSTPGKGTRITAAVSMDPYAGAASKRDDIL